MPDIQVLDEHTIDRIAAGEVVERPSSVVKELVENAIDAGATAITVEIKEGGTSLVRVTDNGQGIPKEQVPLAFLRHATSKIRNAQDLLTVSSLGFRGEALASIAAVAQVEFITKTMSELTGTKYVIEGSKEKSMEDIGAPEGTTFLVRNLFYNTPARKKFLKSPQTEAAAISTLLERLALSHPNISFQLISNNQPKLHTNGNANLKDMIYHIYGRDTALGVLPIHFEHPLFSVDGFIGKPQIARGNRTYETYFLNGRYIKSTLISKSIEDAYHNYLMKHQYPFTVLLITMQKELIDVNVHPSKMEVRFHKSEEIYQALTQAVKHAFTHTDMIPEVLHSTNKKSAQAQIPIKRRPEPFEKNRLAAIAKAVQKDSPYEPKYDLKNKLKYAQDQPQAGTRINQDTAIQDTKIQDAGTQDTAIQDTKIQNTEIQDTKIQDAGIQNLEFQTTENQDIKIQNARIQDTAIQTAENQDTKIKNDTKILDTLKTSLDTETVPATAKSLDRYSSLLDTYEQLTLAEETLYHADFMQEAKKHNYTMIGQLFDTYWLVQVENELFIIDQHAAHEKVLYEKMMKQLAEKEFFSQQLSPPVIVTLNMQEETFLHKYEEQFRRIGFEVSAFGGREYSIHAVPANLYQINAKELFLNMLDGLVQDTGRHTPEIILEKIASMSCKAAVKGNQRLSRMESEQLLADLLLLENPYHCPHGRPTIIAMSKTEIEKKFKRIV